MKCAFPLASRMNCSEDSERLHFEAGNVSKEHVQ